MNLSPNKNILSAIHSNEKNKSNCMNCLKSELNLFKCTNENCFSYFCNSCLEKSYSNFCITCKSGNLVSQDKIQFKSRIFLK